MRPRFLYFDLGNVLLHFDHEIACRQMGEVAGVTPDQIRQIMFGSEGLELQYERGELTTDTFYETFCQRTESRPEAAPLLAAASRIFTPNHGVFQLVDELRGGGLPMGILSNTCPAHWDYAVAEYPLLESAFQVRMLSYEAGSLKPEPEIYRQARQRAGVAPAEVFFVDDRAENIAAAQAAGWDAVRYTSPGQLRQALQQRSVLR